jgi:2-polyprenyl-3-methyl-5-hydroxy-6-metoxy-1,4-benzoquinol methylase
MHQTEKIESAETSVCKDGLIDIRKDLEDFTGLSLKEIDRLMARCGYNARTEFVECSQREGADHWFYLGSRYFLFENAIHAHQIDDFVMQLLPPNAKVWEFGGGTGNISLALAARGYQVSYTELNSLQKDFVAFRAHKHGLVINIIDSWAQKSANTFDLVLAVDVLEHIPDYQTVLIELCETVKPGGLLWETSAFEQDAKNCTHHIDDAHDYKKMLTLHGFERLYGVKAGKLWKKTMVRYQQVKTADSKRTAFDKIVSECVPDDTVQNAAKLRRLMARGGEELLDGNYALALDYLEEAYLLGRDCVEKYCHKMITLLPSEQVQQFLAAVEQAISQEPDNRHPMVKMLRSYITALTQMSNGAAKLRSGDAAGALSALEEAAQIYSRLPDVHYARAVIFAHLGKFGSAKTACLQELTIQPGHKLVLELLRKIEHALGQYAEHPVTETEKLYYNINNKD